MNDDKNSSLELKKRSNQNRKRRLDLRCSVQMLESVVLVKNIKSGKVTLIRVCVPKSQIHIWLFCFTRPCSVFKTRGLFVVGLTRLIEVIKKYKIVDNQTARASPISALFRLARSAWKILILHSVRAKTNYRLNTARQSLAGGRVREFIHYLGALPRGTIFSCGFAHRSQTTARKILGKCLELGEARKS